MMTRLRVIIVFVFLFMFFVPMLVAHTIRPDEVVATQTPYDPRYSANPDFMDTYPTAPIPNNAEYCVIRALLSPDEETGPDTPPSCYGTIEEAANHILNDVGGDESEIIRAMNGEESSGAVIGVEYGDGGTLTVYSPHEDGCLSGVHYLPSMPYGYNDWVTWAISTGNCKTGVHFEHSFYLGSMHNCTCYSMGVMVRRTSSIRWEP